MGNITATEEEYEEMLAKLDALEQLLSDVGLKLYSKFGAPRCALLMVGMIGCTQIRQVLQHRMKKGLSYSSNGVNVGVEAMQIRKEIRESQIAKTKSDEEEPAESEILNTLAKEMGLLYTEPIEEPIEKSKKIVSKKKVVHKKKVAKKPIEKKEPIDVKPTEIKQKPSIFDILKEGKK